MDVRKIQPFVEAVFNVLPQFGFNIVHRGEIQLKDSLRTTREVTALVGLSKKIRGKIAYCMNEETAKGLATGMIGMEIQELDDLAQSAIAEMANMITANAAIIYESQGIDVDISPPTLVLGKNKVDCSNNLQILAIEVFTDTGSIEVNIDLE